MKTVILDSQNNVLNVAAGEPQGEAPEGLRFIVVQNETWVGPGLKMAGDGSFFDPNPPAVEAGEIA